MIKVNNVVKTFDGFRALLDEGLKPQGGTLFDL